MNVDNLRLCSIIEGVEATIRVGGTEVRVIVPQKALEQICGATADASAWLLAAKRHEALLERMALARHTATGKPLVIVDGRR